LLQSDVPANGMVSFHGRLVGTRFDPQLRGTLALVAPTYRGVPYPEVHATLSYTQRRLTVEGDLRRAVGTQLARITGTLPIDLTLGDSVTTRLLEQPLTLEIAGDSIPLAPLGEVTDALSVVNGYARGTIGVRGTYTSPRLEGNLDVRFTDLGITSTGVVYRNVVTLVRASGESLVIDSLVATSGGTIRARGTVGLASLSRPVLDLQVDSRGVRILGNEQGELFTNSRLTIRGPLDTLTVDGTIGVTRGVIYLPDPETLNVISTGDPALFSVIDTAQARELDVLPTVSVLKNLHANVDLNVARGTWARSREANVEIYGDIRIRRDPLTGLPALTGALFTDHGEYTLYGREFVVTRGSARFTGEPDINPELQVMAKHEVRQAGRAPFDIRVVVGGSMRRPNVSLESDAQPTLSQSDLIAFLAFGQSSSSLLQFQGSGLEGGGQSGSSLAGNVASLATRQLAGVAMGALLDEARAELTEATRADVVRIRPAELPADLSLGAFGTVIRGTEVRIGKYIGPRTFLVGQIRTSGTIPGASLERWYGTGSKLKLRASFETRFQPLRPSLTTGLQPETIRVLGLIANWTIGW
jgi:translocation and assembly module TamB